LTLVLDASFVVDALLQRVDLPPLPDAPLLAPPLMWSEARSSLHEVCWREGLPTDVAENMRKRLGHAPIERSEPAGLDAKAWRIADDLGWAKTYDAEYVALASLLGCRLVTVDARLRRGADRLGFVVGPTEL
jgi:predicted nucleic acid-binding protein